ncbi:hypothetical protein LEMLEM_LOCUS18986 [Lemmus lemmus]
MKQRTRHVLATHVRMWSAHWLRCGNHHGKQRRRSLPEEATAVCSPAHHNSRINSAVTVWKVWESSSAHHAALT